MNLNKYINNRAQLKAANLNKDIILTIARQHMNILIIEHALEYATQLGST